MAQLDPITIKVIAEDVASKVLAQVREEIAKTGKAGEATGSSMAGLAEGLKGVAVAAGLAIGIREIVGFLKEGAQAAAEFDEAMTGLNLQISETSEAFVGKLRTATKGTVSDIQLVASANRALALQMKEDNVPELFAIAEAKGKLFGLSTSDAFDKLVTGIETGSPKILSRLGVSGIGGAMDLYAASTGRTTAELSDTERQQIALNLVLDNGASSLKLAAAASDSNADALQRQSAEWENLKIEIGDRFTPVLIAGGEATNFLLKTLGDATEGFKRLLVVSSDQDKILKLADAYQKSGLTFAEFADKAKGKVLEADGSLREFNKDLDDPAIKTYSAELWGVQLLLGDNIDATDKYALTQRTLKNALDDGILSLDEAQFLMKQGTVALGDLNQKWLDVQATVEGKPLKFGFDLSELNQAKGTVDSIVSEMQQLLGQNDLTEKRLTLLKNIVDETRLGPGGTLKIDVGQFAQEGAFANTQDAQNFLKQNQISDASANSSVFGIQAEIDAAIARNDREKERLTIIDQIGGKVVEQTQNIKEQATLIDKENTAQKTLQNTAKQYSEDVQTTVPAVNTLLEKRASIVEREAAAQKSLADDAERYLETLEAIAAIGG